MSCTELTTRRLRVWWAEAFRLMSTRYFWITLALIPLLHLLLCRLGVTQELYSAEMRDYVPLSAYTAATEYYQSLPTEERVPAMRDAQADWRMLNTLEFLPESFENRYADVDKAALLARYQSGELVMFTDDRYYKEIQLYTKLMADFHDQADYDSYLHDIQSAAQNLSVVSLFANENSFINRNILRTAADYAILNTVEIQTGGMLGVKSATGFIGSELLFLTALLLFCMNMVTREKNMLTLLRTTQQGRLRFLGAKIALTLGYTLLLNVLITGSGLFFGHATQGLGDLSRSLQSVYFTAPSHIAVGQYLLGVFLLRCAVFAALGMLILLLCFFRRSVVSAVGALAAVLGISAIVHAVIPSYSYLNIFKYVNFFYALQPMRFFTQYVNLNIFGYPVALLAVALPTFGIISAVCVFLTIRLYTQNNAVGTGPVVRVITSCVHAAARLKDRLFKRKAAYSARIFTQEVWRLFIGQMMLVCMLCLMVFQCWRLYQSPIHIYRTETLFRSMIEQARQQADPLAWAQTQWEELSGDSGAQRDAAWELVERLAYLQERAEVYETEGTLLFDSGYKALVEDWSTDRSVICALVLMFGILLCMISLNEHDIGALTSVTLHGRHKLRIKKLQLLLLASTIVWLIAYLPDFIQVWRGYGLPFMGAAAFSVPSLANIRYLSLAGYLLCLYATRLLTAICIGFAVYRLGKRGMLFAVAAVLPVVIIPLILRAFSFRVFSYYPLTLLLTGNELLNRSDVWAIATPTVLLFVVGGVLAGQRFVRKSR